MTTNDDAFVDDKKLCYTDPDFVARRLLNVLLPLFLRRWDSYYLLFLYHMYLRFSSNYSLLLPPSRRFPSLSGNTEIGDHHHARDQPPTKEEIETLKV